MNTFNTIQSIIKYNKVASNLIASNGSLYCGGASKYAISGATSNYIIGTSNFTLEFWFYPINTTGVQGIMTSGPNASNYWRVFWGYPTSGRVCVQFSVNFNPVVCTVAPILNAWNHVAIVRTTSSGTSNTVNIYINGVNGYSGNIATVTNNVLSGNLLCLGRDYTDIDQEYFSGYITQIRIAKQIVYTGNFTTPTTALQLTQSSGTNIASLTTGDVICLISPQSAVVYLYDNANLTTLGNSGIVYNSLKPF